MNHLVNELSFLLNNLDCIINDIPPKTTCNYTVKFSDKAKLNIIQVKNLRFHAKDNLSVLIGDKNENIDLLFSNGFIVLPKTQKNFTFTISTSDDLGKRLATFNPLNDSKLSLNGLNKVTVLFQNYTYSNDDIYFESQAEEASTLLSSDSKGVIATPVDDKFQPTDKEVELEKQDLLTEKKKIKIKFSNDNIFHFNVIKVDSSCSKVVQLNDSNPIPLNTIDKNVVSIQPEYHCVYQVTTNNQGNIQIDNFNFTTANSFDEIIVKDGLKLTSNDLINSKSKYASTFLNNLEKTVSSSDSLMIILSSTFVQPDYQQGTVSVKKSTIKRNNKLGKFSIQEDKDAIHIFSLDDAYPLLKFQDKLTLPAGVSVYDSLDLSKQPIISFVENEIINNELWTGRKTIVLKFSGSKAFKIEGSMESYKNECNKIVDSPSTFIINGNPDLANKSSSCRFYFKPQNGKSSVVLNIQNLVLFDENSCLILKSVNESKEEFKICQAKGVKENLIRNYLPELILSPKNSYVLTYQFSSRFKEQILLQASFAYNAMDSLRRHNLTELESPSFSLASLNYPNNYPYVLNLHELDTISSLDYIYGSVEKFDLRSGDELISVPKFNLTYGQIDDFVLGPNVVFPIGPLNTKFDSNSLIGSSFNQGYKINFEQITCKLQLNSQSKDLYLLEVKDKFENATKCVSIIDLSDLSKKKATYLKLTIENPKENVDYGRLTIYDGATKQTNLSNLFDSTVLKNNKTINLNATSTKLVVIFDPLGKQTVNGFKLIIKPEGKFNSLF